MNEENFIDGIYDLIREQRDYVNFSQAMRDRENFTMDNARLLVGSIEKANRLYGVLDYFNKMGLLESRPNLKREYENLKKGLNDINEIFTKVLYEGAIK